MDSEFRPHHVVGFSTPRTMGSLRQHPGTQHSFRGGTTTQGIPRRSLGGKHLLPQEPLLLLANLLLLTIVQFLWFKFLNTSVFISTLMESYKVILQSYNLTQAEVNTIIEALAMMKPVGWAATFMITEIIVGTVLSPLIAALMSRKRGKQQSFVNQQ